MDTHDEFKEKVTTFLKAGNEIDLWAYLDERCRERGSSDLGQLMLDDPDKYYDEWRDDLASQRSAKESDQNTMQDIRDRLAGRPTRLERQQAQERERARVLFKAAATSTVTASTVTASEPAKSEKSEWFAWTMTGVIGTALGFAVGLPIPQQSHPVKVPASDTNVSILNNNFTNSADAGLSALKVTRNEDGGFTFTVQKTPQPWLR